MTLPWAFNKKTVTTAMRSAPTKNASQEVALLPSPFAFATYVSRMSAMRSSMIFRYCKNAKLELMVPCSPPERPLEMIRGCSMLGASVFTEETARVLRERLDGSEIDALKASEET